MPSPRQRRGVRHGGTDATPPPDTQHDIATEASDVDDLDGAMEAVPAPRPLRANVRGCWRMLLHHLFDSDTGRLTTGILATPSSRKWCRRLGCGRSATTSNGQAAEEGVTEGDNAEEEEQYHVDMFVYIVDVKTLAKGWGARFEATVQNPRLPFPLSLSPTTLCTHTRSSSVAPTPGRLNSQSRSC